MPSLALHTAVVKLVADRLRAPALDEERGNLYLGSTAPDIRVITRWERERTHFFDIGSFDEQSGVAGLFESHPDLAEAGDLAPSTAAFVAGYLTHLVMDEMWITGIYRPFFGERSPLGGNLRANIMDRAIQFSMDSDVRQDDELMADVMASVARCDLDLGIDFIDRESLEQWQELIANLAERRPTWDRFQERLRQRYAEEGGAAGSAVDVALSLPDIVDETLRYLTAERVEEYVNESLDASVSVVKEYLKCE